MLFAACGRIGFTFEASPSSGDGNLGDDASPTDGASTDGATATAWRSLEPQPGTVHDLWGLHAFGANDLWVSGNQGTVMHFDGAWTATPNPATDAVFVLWGAAPDDVWAVGRNCLAMHWQGSTWSTQTTIPCTPTIELFSVNGSASDNVWITGTGGSLGQFTGTWTDRSTGNVDYWDALVESPTKATIIGTKGTILRWTGSVLSPEVGAPNLTLASIWGDGTDYWIVGEGGTILKRGNASWSAVASPTTQFLYAVFGTTADDLWAVGTGGVMIHYDGATWSLATSPTTMTLRNVGGIPGSGLAAVGDAGTVISYQ